MKLYYAPGACSLAAHIVADEGDVRLQLEKVDLKSHKTENGQDYYAINPKGYVPTIQLDDGSTLTENVASANGGAIYTSAGVVKIINSTISNNLATTHGGGIGMAPVASVSTIETFNSTIAG